MKKRYNFDKANQNVKQIQEQVKEKLKTFSSKCADKERHNQGQATPVSKVSGNEEATPAPTLENQGQISGVTHLPENGNLKEDLTSPKLPGLCFGERNCDLFFSTYLKNYFQIE